MSCACRYGGDCTVNLISACLGAANAGMLADRVARTLTFDGKGSMTCLTAVGAGLSGFLASARSADRNVVIDGCKVAYGEKIFTEKGLPFEHFITTDFGVVKGQPPITKEVIGTVALSIGRML